MEKNYTHSVCIVFTNTDRELFATSGLTVHPSQIRILLKTNRVLVYKWVYLVSYFMSKTAFLAAFLKNFFFSPGNTTQTRTWLSGPSSSAVTENNKYFNMQFRSVVCFIMIKFLECRCNGTFYMSADVSIHSLELITTMTHISFYMIEGEAVPPRGLL